MRPDPIFIVGAHKSGTSLLRALLDGHSKAFVLPFESHFFQNFGFWVKTNYRYSFPKERSIDEVIKVFSDFMIRNNENEDLIGDGFVKGMLDTDLFHENFKTLNSKHSLAETFNLFITASHIALHGKTLDSGKVWVEKSVDHAEFAFDIRKLYPKSKFIHIVRNPYVNVASLRRYKAKSHGYPFIHRVIETLETNYYHLEQNQRLLDGYLVVKYEDLVSDTDIWMRKIANHIGVEYEDVLLQPTLLGKPWKGNSSSGITFNGVSTSRVGDPIDEIYPLEKYYTNLMFSFIADKYGYQPLKNEGNFWRRCKGENIPRYIANRLYKFYLEFGRFPELMKAKRKLN